MRTTLDIDSDLLEKAMVATGAPSKKRAIELAILELLRTRRREQLCDLIGRYDDFALTLSELEKARIEP